MTYVMSDLHGCYNLYLKMLEKIKFSLDDTLYLLGDYVDRGNDGFDIIFDASARRNAIMLLGNHDFDAMSVLSEITLDPELLWSPRIRYKIDLWMRNGGSVTYNKFLAMNEKKKIMALSIMDKLQIYADIEVGGRRFTLCHGGLANYSPKRSLDDYSVGEIIYTREDYSKPKFNEEGRYLVTGHTPTIYIEGGKRGKIYKNHDHIAIDCGAVFGFGLGCICLDTLDEFYVE